MSIGDRVIAELDGIAREMRRRTAPAQYQASDFQRHGPAKARNYVNTRTGEIVSRRKRDELIGRPLPKGTLHDYRARVARLARERGLEVPLFRGKVRTTSGNDRRSERERMLYDPVVLNPEEVEDLIDAWEHRDPEAAGAVFETAFFDAWWGADAGSIPEDPEEFSLVLGPAL